MKTSKNYNYQVQNDIYVGFLQYYSDFYRMPTTNSIYQFRSLVKRYYVSILAFYRNMGKSARFYVTYMKREMLVMLNLIR